MTTAIRIAAAMTMSVLLLFPSPCMASPGTRERNAPRQRINSLIQEFKAYEGFESIRVGPMLISIAKPFIRAEMKEETDEQERDEMKMALDMISGIKRIQVVTYEDCSDQIRERFNARLERLLNGVSMLMEVKDDGETVRMYGKTSRNGRYLNDLLIHIPEEGVLVCLYGRFDMDHISEFLAKEMMM